MLNKFPSLSPILLCSPLLCTTLQHCSNPAPSVAEKPTATIDRLIARVDSVNKTENYILIQRYGRVNIDENSVIYSHGITGNTANLKLSGERLGQFIAADILSGVVQVGNAVYLREAENQN